MSRVRPVVCLAAFFLCVAGAAPTIAAESGEPRKILTVCLPGEIDPTKVTLLCGESGPFGLGVWHEPEKRGPCEYRLRVSSDARVVKLLIYCPGYKMVAAEFKGEDIPASMEFRPRFQKIPMVPIRIRLVDTKSRPIAGAKVQLKHSLLEMEYFNYWDGAVFPQVVATATTNANGEIAVQVPSLLDDPYFAAPRKRQPEKLGFWVELPDRLRERRDVRYGFSFVPRLIPAQRTYPQPVTVTLVYSGKFSGRVEESFLRRKGIPERTLRGVRRRGVWTSVLSFVAFRERSGSGIGLGPDGTFSLTLEPGNYDLSIEVQKASGGYLRSISIAKGVALRENENRVIILK